MKLETRKLTLHRQTIRRLEEVSQTELRRLIGGVQESSCFQCNCPEIVSFA